MPGVTFGESKPRGTLLTFTEDIAADTTINIQDGSYAGGSAIQSGHQITLPGSADAFKLDDRYQAFLNGNRLVRGKSIGDEEINWISSIQIQVAVEIFNGNRLYIVRR